MTLRLRFRLSQDLYASNSAESKTFYCNPEENKRTSFIFQDCQSNTEISRIEKPCHVILDCSNSDEDPLGAIDWIFGGLEIQSNARNIEVYAVPIGKDFGDREYWQTHRGSKIEIESARHSADDGGDEKAALSDELYQSIVLPPDSKPTAIKSLHLKLLSLRPTKCSEAFVKVLKVKGRIPETMTSSAAEMGSSSSQVQDEIQITSEKIPPKSVSSVDSAEQISKAISGLAMMIQTIQTSMKSSIQSTIGEISKNSFSHNQNLTLKISDLEKDVSDLKDSIESLNDNVILLRKDLEFKNEIESSITVDDSNESEMLNENSIRRILEEERQLIVKELVHQNRELLSQAVQQLVCSCQTNSATTSENEIAENSIQVLEEEDSSGVEPQR